MRTITPHLWYDNQAVEAAELYTSVLPNSMVGSVTTLPNTPSGDTDIVSFELCGQPFMAMSAGPLFRFTPAVSFIIGCETADEVNRIWRELGDGGEAMMPLDSYPFSPRYGWTTDRYGVSWQVMHYGDREITQRIIPSLLFVGDVCGKAEEAIGFYASVFPDSKVGDISRYPAGDPTNDEGTVQFGSFSLNGLEMAAMDSGYDHRFAFNESISFIVSCEDQAEIDRYWEALSAVAEAEQCGWLKDRFGLSWQVTAADLGEMLGKGTPEQIARVTEAFLPMKKFDLAVLRKAYEG